MGWVDMSLEGAEPVQYPDNPDVIAAAEAKGYVQVDNPATAAAAGEAAAPDEVDDRGQGWVYLTHAETGGSGRFPVEVVAGMRGQGWKSVAELEAAAKKKTAKKAAPVSSREADEKPVE